MIHMIMNLRYNFQFFVVSFWNYDEILLFYELKFDFILAKYAKVELTTQYAV